MIVGDMEAEVRTVFHSDIVQGRRLSTEMRITYKRLSIHLVVKHGQG